MEDTTATIDNQGENSLKNAVKQPRAKRVTYQVISLPQAIELVGKMINSGGAGARWHRNSMASLFGVSERGSPFKMMVSSLRRYGFIQKIGEDHHMVTERACTVVRYEKSEAIFREACLDAFNNAPYFKEILERFPSGKYGPKNKLLLDFLQYDKQLSGEFVLKSIVTNFLDSRAFMETLTDNGNSPTMPVEVPEQRTEPEDEGSTVQLEMETQDKDNYAVLQARVGDTVIKQVALTREEARAKIERFIRVLQIELEALADKAEA